MSNTTVSPSYSGTALQKGSNNSEVARIQTYLNALRPYIPCLTSTLTVDGKFGSGTQKAVQCFQGFSGLIADGIVGRNTWNALITAYNNRFNGSADTNPGISLRSGNVSKDVGQMQRHLNSASKVYTAIANQSVDNHFGNNMLNAVKLFQRQFGLSADGIVGEKTWAQIVRIANALAQGTKPKVTTPYPGTLLRQGSSGDSVRLAQSYLNGVGAVPVLTVDGKFGPSTKNAVVYFQTRNGLKADGIIGSATWQKLVTMFNATL